MTDTRMTAREQESSRRFLERLRESYRPRPFGPDRRARFDASLRERIERRRSALARMPSLAVAAVGLALLWWVSSVPPPVPQAPFDAAAAGTDWEAELLLVDEDTTLAEEGYLPDEYVAIAFAFIDGV